MGKGGMGTGNAHEKMRAAAAPRKPKKGAVSSPLNADDIFLPYLFLSRWGCSVSGRPRRRGGEEGKVGRQADAISLERRLPGFFLLRLPPPRSDLKISRRESDDGAHRGFSILPLRLGYVAATILAG